MQYEWNNSMSDILYIILSVNVTQSDALVDPLKYKSYRVACCFSNNALANSASFESVLHFTSHGKIVDSIYTTDLLHFTKFIKRGLEFLHTGFSQVQVS